MQEIGPKLDRGYNSGKKSQKSLSPDFAVIDNPSQQGLEQTHINNYSWKDHMKNFAKILDSRESVARIFLEFTADIPWILGAAMRNKLSMLEAVFECVLSLGSFSIAPWITDKTARIVSKFTLDAENQEDAPKLLYFYRDELENQESFEKGISRILKEEPSDKRRVAKFYREIGKNDKAYEQEQQAQDIEKYFTQLEFSESKLKQINKLKERTIIVESSIEGPVWGLVGLLMRFFRSQVLGQDRFTGTKKYLNDKDAEKLGEAAPLQLWQKVAGASMALFSPIVNSSILKLSKDKELLEKIPLLKTINNQLDMVHGIFPKLGLMFSYTSLPKWISTFITAQGFDEFLERVIKYIIGGGSWWMGHKLFNGTVARLFDKHLTNKHGVSGVMISEETKNSFLPEAAKIHEVLDKTNDNAELRKDAEKAHWQTLYGGLGLHSLVIFGICIGLNKLTKWRVETKKAALA
jgi:hypothetical protein